ncbi:hypothetical protein [Dickeya oryzae]|uniref:hypothetical protein n=1 Tax=Dickeya oryzae TaxID=1240404 RepID=UPI003D133FD8
MALSVLVQRIPAETEYRRKGMIDDFDGTNIAVVIHTRHPDTGCGERIPKRFINAVAATVAFGDRLTAVSAGDT